MRTVTVEGAGFRSYEVVVGHGLLAEAGKHIAVMVRSSRLVVISDATVAELHAPALLASLAGAGLQADLIIVPAGEASKSFAELERVLDRALRADVESRYPSAAEFLQALNRASEPETREPVVDWARAAARWLRGSPLD